MPTTQGRPTGENQGSVFQRVSRKFLFRGIDVAHPPDKLAEGRYPFAKNLRAYVDGELRSRPGLQLLFQLAGNPSVHSIYRLNDPSSGPGAHAYIVGAGTQLFAGDAQVDFSAPLAAGLSGDPLTIVAARPDRSPANWAYVANALSLLKVAQDRTCYSWGIPELPAPPTVEAAPPEVIEITQATSLSQDGNTWNASVNAGGLSTGSRISTTITHILFDSGTNGYCGIAPASLGSELNEGTRVRVNSGGGSDETVVIEQVFALIANTTIESISYDTGTSGLCWVQLANPTAGLIPNCLLRLAGAENVRVLDVILDKDNKAAVRCSTTATRSAGDSVAGLRAFRAYCANNHVAGESLSGSYIQSTFTYPGVAPAGVGNIRLNAPRDLSKFASRQVTDEDEVVVTLYLSDASQLVEGRVWFDIDPNTTLAYAADDLSRNYLFFPFRQEDLQTFASFDLTQTQVSATAQNIQRYQFDLFNTSLSAANAELEKRRQFYSELLVGFPGEGTPFQGIKKRLLARFDDGTGTGGGLGTAGAEAPGPFQAGSGKQQWFTLRFKIGQLNRVGQDISRTLKDTTSVMVNFKFKSTNQVVRLGSWYISGGSNPDMKGSDDLRANAYYYIIQDRDSRTGARSLPSPPTRSGVVARRQLTTLNLGDANPNPQVDKRDVYRWGGSRFEFLYLGSTSNTAGATFEDNFSDEMLNNSRPLNFNTFPPFATVALPFQCQVSVVGPKVSWISGDKFNLNWSPGTLIEIASRTYILYGQPTDDQTLYLTESAGTQSNVLAEINSPVVIGNPLPSIWGPYALEGGLFIFATGDPLNPFSIYWTNGNDPDTTSDRNYVEAPTNGSEMVGGCIYDGRPFAFSADEMFIITRDGSGIPGASLFRAEPIANSRGLVSPTAVDSDVYIYFVSKDGIYRSEGGQPVSITNDSLYSLFPHDGINGTSVNGFVAPDYTRTDEFRLTTYGPLVYFDYPGIDAEFHTMIYDSNLQGWMFDEYSNIGLGARIHLGQRGKGNFKLLVGGTNGRVCTVDGVNDLALPIFAELWLPCFDAGDERAQKSFGDTIFDINTGNLPVTVQHWADNYTTQLQQDIIQNSIRGLQLIDFASGDGFEARNLGVKLFISTSSAIFMGWSWQPSFYTQPENIVLRAPDWDKGSKIGAEWFQGVLISADTGGQDVTLEVEFTNGIANDFRNFTINHDGFREQYYPFTAPPVIAHHARIRQVSTGTGTGVSFKNYVVYWVTESYPESSTEWNAQPQGSEIPGWKHLREAWITYVSNDDATLIINLDGAVDYPFTIPSSNGVKKQFYLPLMSRKCRIWTPSITCPTPLVLFERDTVFHIGPWGRQGAYTPVRPFGGPNSDNLSPAYV